MVGNYFFRSICDDGRLFMPYRAFHQYKPLLDTCYIACGAMVAQASVVMGTMSDSRIWLGVNVPQWLGWLLFFLALGFGAAMSVHQESAVDKYIKRPALKPFYSLFLSRLCCGEWAWVKIGWCFSFSKPPVWRWILKKRLSNHNYFSKPPVWRWILKKRLSNHNYFSKPPVWRWRDCSCTKIWLYLSKPPTWRWSDKSKRICKPKISKPPTWRWSWQYRKICARTFSKPPTWRWRLR